MWVDEGVDGGWIVEKGEGGVGQDQCVYFV